MIQTLTRRGLFRRAPLVAAAIAMPAAAVAAIGTVPENPQLLALGDTLEAAERAFAAALKCHQAARAHCEQLAPRLPDVLLLTPDLRPALDRYSEGELDLDGKNIYPPNRVGEDGKTYARQQRLILPKSRVQR